MTHFLIICVILAIMIGIGSFILSLLFTGVFLIIGGITSLFGMIARQFNRDKDA